MDEKIKRKISKTLKGRKLSEETKKKISEAMKGDKNPFYGKHHTKEVKKKMKLAKEGEYEGENNPMYGKHHSESTKKKWSEKRRGIRLSEEHKLKLRGDRPNIKRQKHPNWKGGECIKDGYKIIRIGNGYKKEHRYVMKQHINRKLLSSELVHHRDENKLNNKIDNLQIMTQSEHSKLHAKKYWKEKINK